MLSRRQGESASDAAGAAARTGLGSLAAMCAVALLASAGALAGPSTSTPAHAPSIAQDARSPVSSDTEFECLLKKLKGLPCDDAPTERIT